MAAIELITKEDLKAFKAELLTEIRDILKPEGLDGKKWLKSKQVCKLLGISPSTLATLRLNETILFTKIGGLIFYKAEDIEKVMEENYG